MSYRVENRSLTVVNVSHNANNRCSFDKILCVILSFGEELFFLGDDDFFGYFSSEFICNDFCGSIIDSIVNHLHLAHKHQLLNNLCRGFLESYSEFSDGDFIGHSDFKLLFSCLFCFESLYFFLSSSLFILGTLYILTFIILLFKLLLLSLGIRSVCNSVELIVVAFIVF